MEGENLQISWISGVYILSYRIKIR